MLTITAELGKGILSVDSHVRSVTEANRAGLASAKAALPLSLLHQTLREGSLPSDAADLEPKIWIPSDEDGEQYFVKMDLYVGLPLHGFLSFDFVPDWFSAAVRRFFPKSDWKHCEQQVDFNRMGVEVFDLRFGGFGILGWSHRDGDVDDPHDAITLSKIELAIESEGLDAKRLQTIADFCGTTLTYRITPLSWSHPSGRFRIVISEQVPFEEATLAKEQAWHDLPDTERKNWDGSLSALHTDIGKCGGQCFACSDVWQSLTPNEQAVFHFHASNSRQQS